jgi:glutamate racemase
MRIGVFDSGAGGVSVANAIRRAFPEHEVVYAQDRKNVPYGNKPPALLIKLVAPILQKLVEQDCEIIVIACNTVTTTLLDDLKKQISVPLLGVEPMVEQAAKLTTTNVIAVCATPTTLASKRYHVLKDKYAKNMQVIEPDCSDWALMIERDRVDQRHLKDTIESCLTSNADVIVLGCTHYHWIEETVVRLSRGRAMVLQPEQAVIARLRQALAQRA